MSWTVQQDDSVARSAAAATIPDENLEEILQKVVNDDDDEDTGSLKKTIPTSASSAGLSGSGTNVGATGGAQSAGVGAGQAPPFGTGGGSLYTKSSQVFSPAPLTPSDLQATPVKDPLESFNSWVRTQTPTSSRNSPTPNGSGLFASGATSPPSAQRGLGGMNAAGVANQGAPGGAAISGTPQKYSGTSTLTANAELYSPGGRYPSSAAAAAAAAAASGRPPQQLESILEHRKQLLLQMEELALQEMELRNQGGPTPGPAGIGHGGMGVGTGVGLPMGAHAFPEWSPSAGGLVPSPYAAHSSQHAMMSAFSNGITAESLRGRVYETAKDQHGCRFLQRWLDSNYDGEAVQVIMAEIIPHVAELMTDQYANFLVQKLFDIMPHDVRYSVAQVAAPHIAHIALTPHGTFSVQKLIETIATREEMEIVRESLSQDVVRLVKDVHGNHVIQKVLQRFEHQDKEFIYEAVSTDCANIATNKQGCCVLQRCLEFASPAQHKALVACILQCCLQIVQDPFGNYVLQYVLEANDPSVNDTIAKAFLPHLVALCMNKFSSNVMEKVLRGASQPIRDSYVEMMRNPEVIASLMQDDFGNYVLQTALTMSSPHQSEALVAVIRPLMPMIKNAPYAKKLEAKMDLIMKKKTMHSPHTRGGGGGAGGGGYMGRGQHGGQSGGIPSPSAGNGGMLDSNAFSNNAVSNELTGVPPQQQMHHPHLGHPHHGMQQQQQQQQPTHHHHHHHHHHGGGGGGRGGFHQGPRGGGGGGGGYRQHNNNNGGGWSAQGPM